MKQKLKDNGITLIALVVTIVVLLILAGITITMVLGEDGIIAQAKLAAQKTKEAEEQQGKDLQNLAEQIESLVDGGTGGGGTTTPTPASIKEAIEGGEGFAQNENKEITDGSKSMWVPQGYTVVDPNKNSNVSYSNKEAPKIDEGIVIADDDGNEFVWVPVTEKELATMYGEDSNGNYLGKLYDFGTSSAPKPTPEAKNWTDAENGKIQWSSETSYREPDVATGSTSNQFDVVVTNLQKVLDDYESGKTADDFKKQLQKEFKSMIESVRKYGGFYIGRYETSGLEESGNPAVKAEVVPTVSTDWYTMYKNSKEIAKAGVTSSMIWGSQWDQVMNWMKDVENPTVIGAKYITNSTGMGWYRNVSGNESHETGEDLVTDEKVMNRVKNIYDMAGNMTEWTIEAFNTHSRVSRAGGFRYSGSEAPASLRSFTNPTSVSTDSLATRVTLYVK